MDFLGRMARSVLNRLLIACIVLAGICSYAQAASPLTLQEQKIKAGLVYNFLKYTNWTSGSITKDGGLRVCLVGGDAFHGHLFPLQNRTAQQMPIHIVELGDLDKSTSCTVAVLHHSLRSEMGQLVPQLTNHGVLSISDMRGFAKNGGMVELSVGRDRRIHIFVNQTAVQSAGLDIQDRLLKLSQVVN